MDSDGSSAELDPPSGGAPRAKLRRLDADDLTPHATPATLKEEARAARAAAVQYEELRRADVADEARRGLAALLRRCVASRPSSSSATPPRLRPPPQSPQAPSQPWGAAAAAWASTDSVSASCGAEFGDALPECYHTAVRLSAALATMAEEDLACVAETCGVRFGARATRKGKVDAVMVRWAETAHTGRVEDAVCCLQLPETAAKAAVRRGGGKGAASSDDSVESEEEEGEERVSLRYVTPKERLCRYSVPDLQGFASEHGIELPKNARKHAKVEAILRQCDGIEEALLLYELSDMD